MCKVFCFHICLCIMCVPGTWGFHFRAWSGPVEYHTSYDNLGKFALFSPWFSSACMAPPSTTPKWPQAAFPKSVTSYRRYHSHTVTFSRPEALTCSFLLLSVFATKTVVSTLERFVRNPIIPRTTTRLSLFTVPAMVCIWLVLPKGSCVGGWGHKGMILRNGRAWERSTAGELLAQCTGSPGFEPQRPINQSVLVTSIRSLW